MKEPDTGCCMFGLWTRQALDCQPLVSRYALSTHLIACMTIQGHAVLLMRLLFPALVFARIDHREESRDRARVRGSRWIRL